MDTYKTESELKVLIVCRGESATVKNIQGAGESSGTMKERKASE